MRVTFSPSPFKGEVRWGMVVGVASDYRSKTIPTLALLQSALAQACARRSGGGSHATRNPASTPLKGRGSSNDIRHTYLSIAKVSTRRKPCSVM